MNSILYRISDKKEWNLYFDFKQNQGNLSNKEEADLKSFIENEEYAKLLKDILNGKNFMPPRAVLLGKAKTDKKRTVFVYDREENYILKLIAHLLREYDGIFSPNLYSFRKDSGVKKAIKDILHRKGINGYFTYKLDISDYFNSVNVDNILPILQKTLANDKPLYDFLSSLLLFPYALYNGEKTYQNRGIMAGVPVSGFLANLYLKELDFYFYEKEIPYARYSDDIIVFAESKDDIERYRDYIKDFLKQKGLQINTKKEFLSLPHQEWTFLGFSHNNGQIDVCSASVEKLKRKMRRKSRSLCRWADKNNVDRIKATRVFIKRFNLKFFDNPKENELTWARWFFPIINTDASLHEIDKYMQDCIRYIATGKRNKSRFAFTYNDMKKLGYISLVNEYYKYHGEKMDCKK